MRKQLLKLIHNSLKKFNLSELARNIDIKQPTLHRIVNGKSHGSIETWEKIGKYYDVK